MFFLSLFVYIVLTAFVVLRLFKEIRISRYVILFFISTTAINILVAQTLHFLRELNNSLLYLVVQSIFCLLSVILLIDPRRKIFKSPLARFRIDVGQPTLIEGFLTLLIFLILGLAFFVGTLSPVNNSDSLQTHLPRIYYWLQHGSFESWYPTAITQLSYPVNITLQGLWAFLLSGSEMYFFLPMWLSLVTIAVLLYEIAMLLRVKSEAALAASLAGISFPVVLMQTYSYQGDAFVAAQILCAIFFLQLFYTGRNNIYIYLSALVVAIALGSKQTAIIFLPVYALALLLLLPKPYKNRVLLNTIIFSLLFFGVFSSLKYIQDFNETQTENVHMINPGYVENLVEMKKNPFEGYLTNGLRYAYQAISWDGLNGQLKLNLDSAKAAHFRQLSTSIGIDLETKKYLPEYEEGYFWYDTEWAVNEDASWFGPLSFTLLPLAMIIALARKRKFQKWYLLLAILLLLLFIFAQVVLKSDGWGGNRGRHMTIAVLALAPLFAFLIPNRRVIGQIVVFVIAVCSFYLSLSVILINDNRPIITTNSIYSYLSREIDPIKITNIFNAQYVSINQKAAKSLLLTSPDRSNILQNDYYGRLFYQDTSNIDNILLVTANLETDTPLYLYIERALLEYALFGQNRTRELYPVINIEDVPRGHYVLVSNSLITKAPSGLTLVAKNNEYTLLYNPLPE